MIARIDTVFLKCMSYGSNFSVWIEIKEIIKFYGEFNLFCLAWGPKSTGGRRDYLLQWHSSPVSNVIMSNQSSRRGGWSICDDLGFVNLGWASTIDKLIRFIYLFSKYWSTKYYCYHHNQPYPFTSTFTVLSTGISKRLCGQLLFLLRWHENVSLCWNIWLWGKRAPEGRTSNVSTGQTLSILNLLSNVK